MVWCMYLPTYLFKVCLLKNGVVGTLTHTDWLNCQLPTLVARSQCCKGSSNKSQVSSTVMDNNRQAKSPKKKSFKQWLSVRVYCLLWIFWNSFCNSEFDTCRRRDSNSHRLKNEAPLDNCWTRRRFNKTLRIRKLQICNCGHTFWPCWCRNLNHSQK